MFRRAVYALACVLALSLPALAQEQTGSITGIVKDTSGAVLPGVTVEAKSLSTGAVASTAVTDGSGAFRFPGLRPGKYEVMFAGTDSAARRSWSPSTNLSCRGKLEITT